MENAVFTTLCMVYDDKNRILVQERHGTGWDGPAFPEDLPDHADGKYLIL